MLQRIGYRRLLPAVNFVLFVVLIAFGYTDILRTINTFHDVQETIGKSAGLEGSWDPVFIDRPEPLTHVFADSLNFPAVLLALPFGHLSQGWRASVIVHSVAAVYVLLLWYALGLWLDKRHRPEKAPLRRSLSLVRWAILVLASCAIIAMGAIFSAMLLRPDFDLAQQICSLPAFFWPMFLVYASWWEVRNSRVQLKTAGASH